MRTWHKVLRNGKGRKGQGLVEFALVLPLLLLVLFGIVEFGRIFHAWLTIENAARQAARYATSGQYNEAYCPEVAGLLDGSDPHPGGYAYADMDFADGVYDCRVPANDVARALGVDTEDPDNYWYYQNVEARLEDAARLYSIRDETRSACGSISVDEPVSGDITRDNDFGQGLNGDPTRRGYFHVTLCSTRSPFVFDQDDVYGHGKYTCLFDETPGDVANGDEVLRDDAGGPNDRIVIAITFNHPLITPIRGIANNAENFATLYAQRQMVIERFRTARVIGLPPAFDIPEPPTPTPTPTATPTSTATPTATPLPNCDDITMEWSGYQSESGGVQDDNAAFRIENNSGFDFDTVQLVAEWPTAPSRYLDYVNYRRYDVAPTSGRIYDNPDFSTWPSTMGEGGYPFVGGVDRWVLDGSWGRYSIDFNQNVSTLNPVDFALTALLRTAAGFECVVTGRGPDVPPTCAALDMDSGGKVRFAYDDDLMTGAVINSSGYAVWLDQVTLYWPDGEMYGSSAPYMNYTYLCSSFGCSGIHDGNGYSSPWTANWGGRTDSRILWPGEPHWPRLDFNNQQTPDLRVMGLPLSPRRTDVLHSSLSGYNPSSSSGYLRDNILHPDQFDVDTWWTFDVEGGDEHCLVEFTNFQKGPYIRLNSPPASGELPGGLGDYLMRPSHLAGQIGVPVTSGGPISGTLVVDVTAFDRDYGDSAPDGQGIREVALWVEGPENEQSGHSTERNLLRGGSWSEQRDWYYLTAAPYRVEFDLQQWPDDSYVMTGTHYLYVRAMDRDDDEGLDQLFTLLVVPFEVEPSGVSCDDLVAGDEVLFIQITDSDIYRNAFSDSITNTSDYPVTLNEMVVHWPKGTSGVDGLYPYPNPYINVVYRWDEAGSYSTVHYGNGYTDPWHVTSGWNSETYREIPEGERRLFSNRFDGLYYVDIGDILGLPYNPWYPDYRMAPPASYVSYSRDHSLYSDWQRAYALGGNIVHP